MAELVGGGSVIGSNEPKILFFTAVFFVVVFFVEIVFVVAVVVLAIIVVVLIIIIMIMINNFNIIRPFIINGLEKIVN